jgi:sulfopyruvate decarboxylase subunit beta
MYASECLSALSTHWRDEILVTSLGTASQEWWRITKSDWPCYLNSSMGLAAPNMRVWVIDSDGALSMNLGALLTEGRYQPSNLVHFLLVNDCYQVLGGYPLVNSKQTDWPGMARAAGIKRVFEYRSLEELQTNIENDILSADGHTFVALRVEQEDILPLDIPFEGPEVKYRFGRHVESVSGKPVFGKFGY